LDWREICDRKNDCLDGSDEQQCWQLEVNTCTDNEYQCHNGQCIPIEFYHDNLYVPDCLDQTDEAPREIFFTNCPFTRDFICEEAMCRPGEKDFSCGDGECLNFIDKCYNGRSNIVINDLCSYAIACLMELYDQVDADWCEEFCSNIDCMKKKLSREIRVWFHSSTAWTYTVHIFK
jgi:low density lipoprotein-related protein 2